MVDLLLSLIKLSNLLEMVEVLVCNVFLRSFLLVLVIVLEIKLGMVLLGLGILEFWMVDLILVLFMFIVLLLVVSILFWMLLEVVFWLFLNNLDMVLLVRVEVILLVIVLNINYFI